MDSNHNIYRAAEKDIPKEDKARFSGYLYAKSEDGHTARLAEMVEKQKAELDALRKKTQGE